MKVAVLVAMKVKVALKVFGMSLVFVDDLASAIPGAAFITLTDNVFWLLTIYGVVRITWIWKHQ